MSDKNYVYCSYGPHEPEECKCVPDESGVALFDDCNGCFDEEVRD